MLRIENELLNPGANNLTFARLVLASCVIYSHCLWQISGSDEDIISAYIGAPVSSFAVDGFFFISGFLVYRSLCLKPDINRFGLSRLARLWPGLIVMSLIVSIGGYAFSTEAAVPYVISTSRVFLAHNLTFISPAYTLSGVYCGDVLCNVNGSLWTIPWEVRCYVILALLFSVGLASPRRLARYILPLSAVFGICYSVPAVQSVIHDTFPGFAAYYLAELDRLWIAFALGMTAFLVHRHIPLKWTFLFALIGINLLVRQLIPAAGLHMRTLLAGYLTLSLGFLSIRTFGAFSSRWPDYSYGMYIYAFPVMAVIHFFGVKQMLLLMVLDFGLTLALAAASWHFVEKPALDWLRSSIKRKSPVVYSA